MFSPAYVCVLFEDLHLKVDPALCRCFVEPHVLVSEQMTCFLHMQLDWTNGPVCETLGGGVSWGTLEAQKRCVVVQQPVQVCTPGDTHVLDCQ